jgi:DNA invertase Pin-like site-specific DNA recombinase
VATKEAALRELRAAARRRREVENERDEAIDRLVAAIRQAQAAGVPTTHIARELGISRQRVYKLLERG